MSTVLLQRQMLSDYEPLRREWQREIAVWEAKKKQVEVEQWKKRKQHEAKQLEEQRRAREEYWNFGDARSRAKIDMKRFVREYYLSEDGKEPDRTKTPEPLILGITGQDKFLLVHSVPDLCTAPCSNLHGFGLDICVGWDRTEVDRMAEERTKMVEAKRKREEEEEKREEEEKEKAKLEPHRQYMAQRASTTAPQSFEMANCIGSYIIRCDTMNEYYNGRQRLSLDVSPGVEGTLIASNFLGVIGGTMLLGTAEDKLEELAISLDADSSDPQTPSGTTTMTPTRSASKPPAQSAKQPRTKPAAQRGTSSASVLRQCPGACTSGCEATRSRNTRKTFGSRRATSISRTMAAPFLRAAFTTTLWARMFSLRGSRFRISRWSSRRRGRSSRRGIMVATSSTVMFV